MSEHAVESIAAPYQSQGYYLRCIRSFDAEVAKFQAYQNKHAELVKNGKSLEAWLAEDACDFFSEYGTSYSDMEPSAVTWIKLGLSTGSFDGERCALLIDVSVPAVVFHKRKESLIYYLEKNIRGIVFFDEVSFQKAFVLANQKTHLPVFYYLNTGNLFPVSMSQLTSPVEFFKSKIGGANTIVSPDYLESVIEMLNITLNQAENLEVLKVKNIHLKFCQEPTYILTYKPKKLFQTRSRNFLVIACSTDNPDESHARLKKFVSPLFSWKIKHVRKSLNYMGPNIDWHLEIRITRFEKLETLRADSVRSLLNSENMFTDSGLLTDTEKLDEPVPWSLKFTQAPLIYHINLAHYSELKTATESRTEDDLFTVASYAIEKNDVLALLILLSKLKNDEHLHTRLRKPHSLADFAYMKASVECLDLLLRDYRIQKKSPYSFFHASNLSAAFLLKNLECLLLVYRRLLSEKDPQLTGATLIHLAAHHNHGFLLDRLINEFKIDVNFQYSDQYPTALIYAVLSVAVLPDTLSLLLTELSLDPTKKWRGLSVLDIVNAPDYVQKEKQIIINQFMRECLDHGSEKTTSI